MGKERSRQINKEKWSTKHDDEHTNFEMCTAAACYALNLDPNNIGIELETTNQIEYTSHKDDVVAIVSINKSYWVRYFWPWAQKWFKPTNPRRDLIKSCALLVAEIERLDRAEAKTNKKKK